jgi:AraC family transcriptional regulator
MVCPRCIRVVSDIFRNAGIEPLSVDLGVVTMEKMPDPQKMQALEKALEAEGFAILDDTRAKLVEEIRQLIIKLVHYGELDEMNENLSGYLSSSLHRDYSYLSHVFSAVENNTIEQYFILQKIEKVKEWLVYGEMTLSEMAFRLGYSSTAHLSSQFRKITGFTPSQFRQLKDHHRKPIDGI